MRLDHLLSREIRAPIIGEIGALMAPRLIARSIVSPVKVGGGMDLRVGADRERPWREHRTRSHVRIRFPVTLQSLRAQPRVATEASISDAPACRPGGRLAQLVRALP